MNKNQYLTIFTFFIALIAFFTHLLIDREYYTVKSLIELIDDYSRKNGYTDDVIHDKNIKYIQLNLISRFKLIKLKALKKSEPYRISMVLKSNKKSEVIIINALCLEDHVKFIEIKYSNLDNKKLDSLKSYIFEKTNYKDIVYTQMN